MSDGVCSIEGCDRPLHSRTMCQAHRRRTMKHGSPFEGKTPRGSAPTEVERAIACSDQSQCWLWPYTRHKSGYARITVDGRPVPVPTLICERVYGPRPSPEHQAAHSCGNGHLGCVNPHHLRWATAQENVADRMFHAKFGRLSVA